MPLERAFYYVGKWTVRLYVRICFKIDIDGLATHPTPCIYAINHPTTSDPFIITALLPGNIKILIHEDLFKIPLFGAYLRFAGHIPVTPGKGYVAFEKTLNAIKKGHSIAVFIEGGLSPQVGSYLPPRTGAVRLAATTSLPVIPIGVAVQKESLVFFNTNIDGKTARAAWLKGGPYAISVGSPVRVLSKIHDRHRINKSTQSLMQQVVTLANQSLSRIPEKKDTFPLLYLRFARIQPLLRFSLALRSIIAFIFPTIRT